MRVLVTGASGLVGSAVAQHLTERGHQVVGMGRRLTKGNRRLAGAIAADIGRPGLVSAIAADRQQRCDAIVHAAAAIERDPHAPSIALTNGLGTQQLLELAALWEVESFVYLSSLPVIGRPATLPVTETHPVDPPSAYHASKLFGERLVELARRSGTPAITLRLTSPVGPGMPEDRILPAFIRRALAGEPLSLAGTGARGQDYVDVRDVAAAIEAALERRATGLLNIASGRCITNCELARRCVELLDSSSEVVFSGEPDSDDEVRWEVSIAAAAERLGYAPAISLDDSIATVAGR